MVAVLTKDDTLDALQDILQDVSTAVDIGIGRGWVAEVLAAHDIDVDAFDKELQRFDNELISFYQADVRDIIINETYDLVVLSYILHYLSNEEAHSLIQKLKDVTVSPGYHFIVAMNDKEQANLSDQQRISEYFYPTPSSLMALYEDWRILCSESGRTPVHEDFGMGPHYHNITLMLATKPQNVN